MDTPKIIWLENCGDEKLKEWINHEESYMQKYSKLMSKREMVRKCNPQLWQEFQNGPIETEGRPASTFKYREYTWKLENRLISFKGRLVGEFPKYEDVITLYCDLFLKLGKNPIKNDTSQELTDILSGKLWN